MNFFDQIAGTGDLDVEGAEVKLDLRNMERQDALHTLDHTVKYAKKTSAKTMFIRFNPARPGEGETLFQPVARYFKVEKMNGYVESATPVMSKDAGGMYVKFK
ncbi:MAG TPA: hypothetical protein VEF76_07115 [Patescibacteria group bacterium]|nr:hypothetical protein [Patescibacteria group bacterium]